MKRERREGIITSLVTIASSRISGRIVDYLLKHGATTIPELEYVIPTTKATASRTLKRLHSLEITELIGYVGPPYRPRSKPGPRIPIYALRGVDPQASKDAQRRFGEIQQAIKEPSLIRQGQLPEAIALCKTYMGNRGLKAIPDSRVLMPRLEAAGIAVNFDRVATALRKEGYNL